MKLRLKHVGRALVSLACSLTLVLSVVPVHAEDKESLESKTSDLKGQLAGINNELLSISDEISTNEMQVEVTNGEIQRTKDSLAEAEANEAKQYEDMKSRIKYMYETGNSSLLQILFSAEDMSDFLNKADFIQNISDYDRDMLLELQKTQKKISDQKDTLEAQQNSMQQLQTDLKERQDELVKKAAATSTDLNTYNAKLEKLRADEAARLAAEAQAKAAAAAEAVAANVSNTPGRGSGGTVINTGGTSVSGSELDIFAAILDCEAMHDYNSMLAVATVIMNRVQSPSFPNSISDVVYAYGQFEPVQTGRIDTVLSNGPSDLAYSVAQDAISGARLAEVADCYFFLYAGTANRPGVNIGNNLFFPSW
ncbi:cell wall hydrolase [Muricomes intestini]|uniref:Peptidoglycan hydrolase CwlO-like protein n=1 Tax=Muricomes intestini TaxID=1796634 RepID=A0A4V2URR4_9FIRM|nr:cell wall hydrolase [Muricomes intestini]TCS78612.1 peptidoglycan hydrolase CwlO-like protein [Muricomes intestini]HCR82198.1 cell wall hydrolase [Lachnospiraceae bacterium]